MLRLAVACLLAASFSEAQQTAVDPYRVNQVEDLEEVVPVEGDEEEEASTEQPITETNDEEIVRGTHGSALKARYAKKSTYRAPPARRTTRRTTRAPTSRSSYRRTTRRAPANRRRTSRVVVRKTGYRPTYRTKVVYRAPVRRRTRTVIVLGNRSAYYRTTGRRTRVIVRSRPVRRRTVIVRRMAKALAPALAAVATLATIVTAF